LKNNNLWIFLVIGFVIVICGCIVLAFFVLGGLTLLNWSNTGSSVVALEETQAITDQEFPHITPSQLEPSHSLTPEVINPASTITPGSDSVIELTGAQETFNTIQMEQVPINDPIKLAQRLEGKLNVPLTLETSPIEYSVGDQKSFFLSNSVSNETFQVQTSLRYETEHLYFFIENGVQYDEEGLKNLCETFENKIYPTNRDFFGTEWTPGVDNDPHLYVVFAGGLGGSVAGAYSASDQYHPDAREFSNAHEMFMINADLVDLTGEFIYGTMAHEFQHMIHWYQDRNEETWISEGFSTLSQLLNGYRIGGSDISYIMDPDLQLNTWPNTDNTFPHYGASFLFASYFLDRFGKDAVRTIISHPDNGLDGFDVVLNEINALDSHIGDPVGVDDFFADWVVATYLNDRGVEDGRYAYQGYANVPVPDNTEELYFCNSDWLDREVKQYGVDYIQINCPGEYTLVFEGASEVGVLPENPYSGDYAFWSNKGDESNMTLTRLFDFSTVSGPITMIYRTWYDLEKDYDYLHVLVSEDGQKWEILQTPSGTEDDPSGNSYGWGYNGRSNTWIEESLDLSRFAGKEIYIRFEYITDMAVNGEGFLLDEVRIPEIQYSEGFETDEGNWEAEGFIRIQNRLPQTFRISIIKQGKSTSVDSVKLNPGQSARFPLVLGEDIRNAVLVVSGTTRYTIQPAQYRFRLEE